MKKIEIACVIDDDPIYIFGIKKMMDLTDFCESYMVFRNGKEAIENLRPAILSGENIPCVILLDLNMPVMDGWEFLEEFVKIPSKKEIVVIIVTSSIDPADEERARKYHGINNYVIKSVTAENLREILSNI